MTAAGLELREEENERFLVDNIVFGSAAEKAGIDFDWEIKSVQVKADRPPKQLMFGPAVVVEAVRRRASRCSGWLLIRAR